MIYPSDSDVLNYQVLVADLKKWADSNKNYILNKTHQELLANPKQMLISENRNFKLDESVTVEIVVRVFEVITRVLVIKCYC